jgi:hypothetical protein
VVDFLFGLCPGGGTQDTNYGNYLFGLRVLHCYKGSRFDD